MLTLVAGVGMCALAGCWGGPGATPTGLPDGVTVAVTQLRSDVADRQMQVQIRNGSSEPLTIGAVRLDDPRFEGPATRVVERTSTVAPGAAVNIRVQLPGAACDAPDEGASTVMLDVATDGGSGSGSGTATATAPASEAFPFLAALHHRECVAQAVDAVAQIDLVGFTPSAAGALATLELAVAPRGRDSGGGSDGVVLTGIRETNLLTFDGLADGALGLDVVIDPDQGARTIALPLRPARCDPHAVQEDKRGTVFTVDVEVDGQAGQFTLAADPDLKARILTWVTAWCGYG